MITVSLANLKQNIRIIKHSKKRVFVDLSYDAFGHGMNALYDNLRFDADGFIWNCTTATTAMYSADKTAKRPLIVSRSSIEKNLFNALAVAGATVVLNSIFDLENLKSVGSSTSYLRVIIEHGALFGIADGELNHIIEKIKTTPAYNSIKVLGILCNEGLDAAKYSDLKARFPDLDILAYDEAEHSDIILASKLLYGYNAHGNLSLHRSCQFVGNVLDSTVTRGNITYITDLPFFEWTAALSGDVAGIVAPVVSGGATLSAAVFPAKTPVPKTIEFIAGTSYFALVSALNALSSIDRLYSNTPLRAL